MKKIKLKKDERYFLDNTFFIIKKGRVLVRSILSTGKVIVTEYHYEEGEIVGNFFKFIDNKKLNFPEVGIEIEAFMDTELEEIVFLEKYFTENILLQKVTKHLTKRLIIEFLRNIYDSKGYILSILKLYANDNMLVNKKDMNFEVFNISKSQYYLKISELKKENYIEDVGEKWKLNLREIKKYLIQCE